MKKITIMKLKIQFGEEPCFVVPCQQSIRSWTQRLQGTRHCLRSLALAEQCMPIKREVD
jgi:hypothetical protein